MAVGLEQLAVDCIPRIIGHIEDHGKCVSIVAPPFGCKMKGAHPAAGFGWFEGVEVVEEVGLPTAR